MLVGQLLLRAAGRHGLFGLMHRSAGPQIRGGESLVMLRFAASEVACQDDGFQWLFALDWKNFERFSAEVPLFGDARVFADDKAGPAPAAVGRDAEVLELSALAQGIDGGRPNMVLLGRLARGLGIPRDGVDAELEQRMGGRGEAPLAAARACVAAGYEAGLDGLDGIPAPVAAGMAGRWLISGNEAAGLGALHGGVRFVAAYPITPASDVLEWMSPRLEALGGRMVQAEDELASINMTIGASFGGVPAMTATSGPGLALMTEALGLAVASETPVAVLDVMRGGPSTGIPTKSEQSDLHIALNGLHGDAPHLVTAPLSIADCAWTMAWSVSLAERLQAPVLVLSDQSLGQSQAVVTAPQLPPVEGRKKATAGEWPYQRYSEQADRVSPMAIPGEPGCMYTADGLEHGPSGLPSTRHVDHVAGLDKRLAKLTAHDFGDAVLDCHGDGALALVCWGSLGGVTVEAARRLGDAGVATRAVCVRLLQPLPVAAIGEALRGCDRVLVVEHNHGAQFLYHLRAHGCVGAEAASLARPGPLPIRPRDIIDFVGENL